MLARVSTMAVVLTLVALLAHGGSREQASGQPPFGGQADIAFAKDLWRAMEDYRDWKMQSDIYPGTSPHGAFLRVSYNLVHVDGKPYHLIVKENFGGQDATRRKVVANPDDYRGPVTIMLQREAGYDPAHGDWFWVKYEPDGDIAENDKGRALAGRVAKGAQKGCIACHGNAAGGDYVFNND